APGGVLAVQMPDNLAEPTHRLMRAVAGAGPWSAALGDPAVAGRLGRMLEPAAYYDLLAPRAAAVDVWRTAYHHRMADAAAIVD
ncbi:trans-aconitate 2-methyltransferase, partial [Pseudomonas sp. MPR-R1B]